MYTHLHTGVYVYTHIHLIHSDTNHTVLLKKKKCISPS